MTTSSAGKMHSTSGKTIFMGAFIAISAALWRRARRIVSAWTRSTRPIVTPVSVACTTMVKNALRLCEPIF